MYRDYTNIPVDYINQNTAERVIQIIKELKPESILPSNLFFIRRRLSLAVTGLQIPEEELSNILKEKGYELADKLIYFLSSDITELFRDADMWMMLEELLKNTYHQNKKNLLLAETTRGEELFSLLILLNELNFKDHFKITIEGPSIWALNQILEGEIKNFKLRSSLLNLKNVLKSAELSKYTFIKNNAYYFNPDYLKEVEIENSKLKQYDLILCRNKVLQNSIKDTERIYSKCQNKLADHGFLIIGTAERLNTTLFNNLTNVFKYENIYKKGKMNE